MRLGLKILMVIGLTVAILVPLMLIRGTIHERQMYREQVVRDIASSFGGRQVVGGPVLVVPYTEEVAEDVTGEDGVVRRVLRRKSSQWTFFPATQTIDGALAPDTRKRGLHQVRVYQWTGSATALFDAQLPADASATRRTIGEPWLSMGIADVGGLQGTPAWSVDGKPVEVGQGIGHADGPGIHTRLAVPATGSHIRLQTRIALTLRGTETFAMMPYAANNDLRVRSPWPHPRFDGKSPQQDVDAGGFHARWQIAAVATNAQRRYLQHPSLAGGETPDAARTAPSMPWEPQPDSVSVSLIDPVNPYLQADRATKYGLLFVALTFIGFFMFELLRQIAVHPIQYLLVGLAIAIFFLLLVSLSEHMAFGWSYLVAACACIGLIGFYLSAVLRSTARGAGFAAMLAALYATLYGLLLSEDNALVLGSGLLFLILATIMVVTRRIDWYRIGNGVPQQR